MAAFAFHDELIQAASANQQWLQYNFHKRMQANTLQPGRQYTTWKMPGMPGAGANPASVGSGGTSYSNTAGGMCFADLVSNSKYFQAFDIMGLSGQYTIYDRLTGAGSVSIAGTGNVSITIPALPRYTDGVGVECWIEITTAVSLGTPVITLSSYTDQAGNTGHTSPAVTLPATPDVDSMYRFPWAADDYGVRSVAQINVGTLGTSGVVSVVLLKPLVTIPVCGFMSATPDLKQRLGALQQIADGSTLMVTYEPASSASFTGGHLWGMVHALYK